MADDDKTQILDDREDVSSPVDQGGDSQSPPDSGGESQGQTCQDNATPTEGNQAGKAHAKRRGRAVQNDASTGMRQASSHTPGIVVRIAYAIVFVVNVQCALSFALWPDAYVSSYELDGLPGEVAIRGIGIAFLMWNATYPAVIVSPRRFRSLAVVVIVQQIIGLVGEWAIACSIPAGHDTLFGGIVRFVVFDAIGLVIMVAAFVWFCIAEHRKAHPKTEGQASSRKERRAERRKSSKNRRGTAD